MLLKTSWLLDGIGTPEFFSWAKEKGRGSWSGALRCGSLALKMFPGSEMLSYLQSCGISRWLRGQSSLYHFRKADGPTVEVPKLICIVI